MLCDVIFDVMFYWCLHQYPIPADETCGEYNQIIYACCQGTPTYYCENDKLICYCNGPTQCVSDEDSSGDDDNDDDSHSLMTAIVVLLSIIVVVLLGLGGVAYRRYYHKSENGDHVQEKADDNKVKLLDE